MLDEPADKEPVGVRSAMQQLVHRPGKSVKGEDNVYRVSEQFPEQGVTHAVRVVPWADKAHQIDDVDHPGSQLQ